MLMCVVLRLALRVRCCLTWMEAERHDLLHHMVSVLQCRVATLPVDGILHSRGVSDASVCWRGGRCVSAHQCGARSALWSSAVGRRGRVSTYELAEHLVGDGGGTRVCEGGNVLRQLSEAGGAH
jgi:hypothetical protein